MTLACVLSVLVLLSVPTCTLLETIFTPQSKAEHGSGTVCGLHTTSSCGVCAWAPSLGTERGLDLKTLVSTSSAIPRGEAASQPRPPAGLQPCRERVEKHSLTNTFLSSSSRPFPPLHLFSRSFSNREGSCEGRGGAGRSWGRWAGGQVGGEAWRPGALPKLPVGGAGV